MKCGVDGQSFSELDTNLYVIFRKGTNIVFQGNVVGLEKARMDVDKTKRRKESGKAKKESAHLQICSEHLGYLKYRFYSSRIKEFPFRFCPCCTNVGNRIRQIDRQ